jgi:hypothetical protein
VIVVDGRTDEEKLLELLAAGAEETALDFKATLDISPRASRAKLDFVKDAISMCNLPDGGYIVVGVDDSGRPAHGQPAIAVDDFDSATLRAKVARYVEAQVHIVSQRHTVDGRDVALIHIQPNPDGLPVPMSVDGQYVGDDGRNVTVFVAGEVLVREGTSNIRLRYAHWHGLLARYRRRVLDEARRDVDALVRAVVDSSGAASSPMIVPLDLKMEPVTLGHAVVAALDSPTTVRIEQFLNTAVAEADAARDLDEVNRWLGALDALTVVACQAVLYRRDGVFGKAIDGLERVYKAAGPSDDVGANEDTARHSLDVILRVFAIGALIVRTRAWALLPTLVIRPVQVAPHYVYASWLRHATVRAARAGLLQGEGGRNRGGQAISLARGLVAHEAAFRPDYAESATLPGAEQLAHDDWLLNSLCQFDLWWCIIAAANVEAREGHGGVFYPSCAALHRYRAQPALDTIASDDSARSEAFPGLSDTVVATAMAIVVRAAVRESHNYGGFWEGVERDSRVHRYVADNAIDGDITDY